MIGCSRGSWGSKIIRRIGRIAVVSSFQLSTHLNEAVVNEQSVDEPLQGYEKRRNNDRSWENLRVFCFDDMSKLYQRAGEEENADGAAKQS